MDAARRGEDRAEDAALVIAAARGGDQDAFAELVRRHQSTAYTFAVWMVYDRRVAADVTRDALVHAWTRLPSFDGRWEFSTWVQRLVLEQCRRLASQRRLCPPCVDLGPAPSGREDDDDRSALARDVVRLPLDQRSALVTTAVLGHSDEQAGRLLGVPALTVRERAKAAFRAMLTQRRTQV